MTSLSQEAKTGLWRGADGFGGRTGWLGERCTAEWLQRLNRGGQDAAFERGFSVQLWLFPLAGDGSVDERLRDARGEARLRVWLTPPAGETCESMASRSRV